MKLPKDFGRIKMEEELQRQDAKQRMVLWQKENGGLTWKDYVYIIPAATLPLYLVAKSVISIF